MNAKDAIKYTFQTSLGVLKAYLGDLTDADLLRRPGPGCNHIAWQLGHLISSECSLLNGIRPGSAPDLPAGFAERHSKENAGNDDPAQYCSKQTYLELMDKVNAASLALLEAFPEADFDQPAPERFRSMFPTIGHIFVLIATHPMMHAGQFVPVRRALGKPVTI